MSNGSAHERKKIAGTDDLHISPFRKDGKTCGTPTWRWSVVVGDSLDVRAYNGSNSRRYQAARRQKAGPITAAAVTKEVSFESVDGAADDVIDEAYRKKYRGSAYLTPIIGARAATGKIVPHDRKENEPMPHVIVKLWPGKSDQQKARLADRIAQDVMEIFNSDEESVSVGFEEISSQDWKEKVYKPDIKDKWDKVYKKPGYEM